MNIEIIDTTIELGSISENIIGIIELGNVTISTGGLDPNSVYTKTEVDTFLDGKQVKKLATELYTNANEKTYWNNKADSSQIITNLNDLNEKSYTSLDNKPKIPVVTNDFDNNYKIKVDNIEEFAQVNVNSDWNSNSGDSEILNRPDLSLKQDILESGINIKTVNNQSLLGTGNIVIGGVGTTDHDQLTNRDMINQHSMSAITGLDTALNGKQSTLESGVNIKTINNTSLLGTGNIDIGGTGTTDHSVLTNRNIADQHTISSITGLTTALSNKAETSALPTKMSELEKDIDFDERYYTESEIDISLVSKENNLPATPVLPSTKYLNGNKEWSAITGFSPTDHNHSGVYEPVITTKNTAFNKNFGTTADTVCAGDDTRLSDARTPTTHQQAISTIVGLQTALDNKANTTAMPTDATLQMTSTTANNASTAQHGFAPTAIPPSSGFVNYLGLVNGETGFSNKPLFNTTLPSTQAFGDSATAGTGMVASRIDHKHAMPVNSWGTITGTLSNQTDLQTALDSKINSTVFYTQTNLSIDGNNGNFIFSNLSANTSVTLSNIVNGIHYYIVIYNSSASAIVITLPNTADIKASTTVTVNAGKRKELAFIYNGTTRIWQISEELT